MYLFYVYGSGLGHLSRVLDYIHQKKIPYSSCTILTNSKWSNYIIYAIDVIQKDDSFFKNETAFISSLKTILKKKNITNLVVDVFPSGFYGELSQIETFGVKTILLARNLSFEYFKQFKPPIFDILVCYEKIIETKFYNYKLKEELELSQMDVKFENETLSLDQKPFFYILHSQPKTEVLQLYKMAKHYQNNNQNIYIQTFCNDFDVEDKTVIIIKNKKPYKQLFDNCEKLFTACGFNTFYLTESYRNKQYFIPFKRKYDDQFLRKNLIIKKMC